MLESQSKAQKTWILAWFQEKFELKKIPLAVGAQGLVTWAKMA